MKPIHIASKEGQIAKLRRLIKAGCDVNQVGEHGTTPAFIAAENGQTAALEILVKAGCDVNQARNDGGRQPSSLLRMARRPRSCSLSRRAAT
jgi:ankyrin repeat protein